MNSAKPPRPDGTWLDRLGRGIIQVLVSLVDFARRRAWIVLGLAVLLTGGALYYTATHFGINTDMREALSRDLPFQKIQDRLDREFPQLNDTVLVVLDGDSAGLASDAARRLAAWLQHRPAQIDSVYLPGGSAFFRRNGLLYLSEKDLWALSNRLSEAQPLISKLSQNPSLPGLLSLLELGLDQEGKSGPHLADLGRIFAELRATMTAREQGRFYQIPWGELMTGASGSEESRRAFLIAKPRFDYRQLQPALAGLQTIRAGIRALHLDPAHGVRARITGSAALDNDQLKTVSQGAGYATLLSVGLVLVLLIVALRSGRMVGAALLTLFMGLAWTAAFALLATGPLNLMSVAFAVLFVGLGVDFSIQFSMRYREEYDAGAPHAEALRLTGWGIGGALCLAAASAAISFYSFVPTDYAGIVDLGIISGTSMFIALLANITVLPALLTLMPVPHRKPRARGATPLRRIPVDRYGRPIAVGAALLALLSLPLVMHARFDFNPLHLQDPHSEAVATFDYLLQHSKTSPYTIDLLEPDLAHAEQVAARLGKLKVVSNALTLASYVPDDQNKKLDIIQQMSLLLPPFALLPAQATAPDPAAIRTALQHFQQALEKFHGNATDGALTRQAKALADTIRSFLRRFHDSPRELSTLQDRVLGGVMAQLQDLGQSLNAAPVTLKTLPESLRSRYLAPDGSARVEVFSTLDLSSNRNMRRFVDAVRTVAPNAAGAPVMLVEGGDAVVKAFREATTISLVLISALLLLALRSVADSLTVLIPLGLAALLTVAAMEVVGISFNLANIIVLPLLIGLGVAFGIYLVMRWRAGVPVNQLLQTSTPEAVLFSALTTMSSFGSLAVARDPGMSVLGKTLSISLTAVLLSILILLPALLVLRGPAEPPTPHRTTP
ncbi:MAG TPA: MMPL family transporter [Gammaproteobacteria bacterium]|nr:MMPL family transporter [Gammaproteobacteria bacterium]